MKKILLLLILLALPTVFVQAEIQTQFTGTFTATGTQPINPVKVLNSGANSFTLLYNVTGAPASVSIRIKGSADNAVSFSTCGAAGTATTGTNVISCVGTYTHVAVELTTLTGGTVPTVNYGFFGSAGISGFADSIQGTVANNTTASPFPVVVGFEDSLTTVKYWPSGNVGDGAPEGNLPEVNIGAYNGNGTGADRLRTASLTNFPVSTTLTSRNLIGAVLSESDSRWVVNSAPAAGSQATASIASEASVRHVLDKVCFSSGSAVAPVLTSLQLNIRDGATGAGTILMSFEIEIPAATGENTPPICTPPLNLVGTTATAMTAEWSAGLANLKQTVTITGYNVN